MNGLEHCKVAETILDDLKANCLHEIDDHTEYDLRVAAVHAQLATAGAVGALVRTFQRVFEPRDDSNVGGIADELAGLTDIVGRLVDRVAAIGRVPVGS